MIAIIKFHRRKIKGGPRSQPRGGHGDLIPLISVDGIIFLPGDIIPTHHTLEEEILYEYIYWK